MAYLRTEHEAGPGFHQASAVRARRDFIFNFHHNLFVSAAHTEQDLAQSFEIFADALQAVKKQFKAGSTRAIECETWQGAWTQGLVRVSSRRTHMPAPLLLLSIRPRR